jgi:hypothetical protein
MIGEILKAALDGVEIADVDGPPLVRMVADF